jgi:hypothetical protein
MKVQVAVCVTSLVVPSLIAITALNCIVFPWKMAPLAGVTVRETRTAGVTVTVAELIDDP